MARIRLELPAKTIFRTTIPVRITDINYGNHLGNDSLVSILHEARVQWLSSLGYTELNVGGPGLIMSDLAVEYKNEGFAGDILSIDICVGDVSAVSFELYYKVSNQESVLIAKAKTTMITYEYSKKKVTPVPSALLEKLTV